MSNLKKITLYLPDEVSEYLKKLPRGFRRPFLEALILEARERFKSPAEISQFILSYSNLFKSNEKKEGKMERKAERKVQKKPQPAEKKEGKQKEHGKGDVSKLDKMEGFF